MQEISPSFTKICAELRYFATLQFLCWTVWNALGLLSIQTPPGRTVATLVNHKDLSAHILADGVHNLIVDTSNTSYTATMHRVALQLLASPGQGINQAGKVSNYRILLKRVQQELL